MRNSNRQLFIWKKHTRCSMAVLLKHWTIHTWMTIWWSTVFVRDLCTRDEVHGSKSRFASPVILGGLCSQPDSPSARRKNLAYTLIKRSVAEVATARRRHSARIGPAYDIAVVGKKKTMTHMQRQRRLIPWRNTRISKVSSPHISHRTRMDASRRER